MPKPDDGVALVSTAHPKGPGVGRGKGRLHKVALETTEIELPETIEITLSDGSKGRAIVDGANQPGLTLRKRAPKGSFDKKAYQRELMKRRRAEGKA